MDEEKKKEKNRDKYRQREIKTLKSGVGKKVKRGKMESAVWRI